MLSVFPAETQRRRADARDAGGTQRRGGQGRIVQAIITPKQSLTKKPTISPCLRSQENHTTCAPCFAEGSSASVTNTYPCKPTHT